MCFKHGIFEQRPNDHLKGDKCYKCSNFVRNTIDFIEKANKIHNNTYSYEKTDYKKSRKNGILFKRKPKKQTGNKLFFLSIK